MPSHVVPRHLLLPTLVAIIAACGGDSTSPPKPAAATAAAGNAQTATVGTAVPVAPTVKVTDGSGNAVSGITVTFAVALGGGTLGRTSATTDNAGTASAGTWTLSTAAGEQAVDATVTGLTSPVRFAATATPAAPTTMTVSAGDAQTANVGDSTATRPAVTLRDQYGNRVPGVAVTWAVVSGGGTLAAATATTDAQGVASARWTLGIATGAQGLRATAGTLTASVTATAAVPAGCTVTNYALGASLALNWDANDCLAAGTGRRFDRLRFTTTTQQQVEASVNGPSGRWLTVMRLSDSLNVGLQPSPAFSPTTQNPMKLKCIFGPGTYEFQPTAPSNTATGAYTLSTTTGTPVDCDYIVFATPNVQFTDSIKTAPSNYNCGAPGGGREQWINLQLRTGMKVRLTVSNIEFNGYFLLRDDRLGPASPTLVFRNVNAGETSVIDWTATFDTWHEVIVGTRGQSGRYTLKIEQLP